MDYIVALSIREYIYKMDQLLEHLIVICKKTKLNKTLRSDNSGKFKIS